MSDIKHFHHGRFAVSGGTLPDAITAYRTYGDPKNPCIVFPVCFGGRIQANGTFGQDWLIGDGLVGSLSFFSGYFQLTVVQPLDPARYFIVTFALFGNGEVRPRVPLILFLIY